MAAIDLGFRVLRNTFPILNVPFSSMTLVTRYDDVKEVLEQPNVFDVTYKSKIELIMDGGNIFLGMNDTEEARRDKANMRLAAPPAEALSLVGPRTDTLARAAIDAALPNRRIDLAMELSQAVTTKFFGPYFGIPGRSMTEFSDQARFLFGYMFADMGDEATARSSAADMRAYVETCIAERKRARGQHDDMLERCLAFQDSGMPGMDDIRIRDNLIGLIVGALPQAPMLIPQLFDILLDRPKELAGAQAAALADDDALVAKYVFEASRYYPLTPGLIRQSTADYRIAAGTRRAKTIRKGRKVVAATRSAMFDGRRVSEPLSFRLDRPDSNYMHFGHGMHECFGLHMNRVQVPAICKAVLKRPGLRRAVGDAGKLQMKGIFPTSLVVEFDS